MATRISHDRGGTDRILTTEGTAGNSGVEVGIVVSTGYGYLPHRHTWKTTIAGGPTSIQVDLEGSIDGSTWSQIDTSTAVAGELRHIVNKPVRFVRAKLVAIAGGASPTATVDYAA